MELEQGKREVSFPVKNSIYGMNETQTVQVADRFSGFYRFGQHGLQAVSMTDTAAEITDSTLTESGLQVILQTLADNESSGAGSSAQEKHSTPQHAGTDADCAAVRILIAEDDDSNYLLAKVLLKDFQLTRARNGVEAVDLAKEHEYDLILMDIRMPLMDGVEATRLIRQFNADIPIIAVTAYAFDENKQMALEGGINDFLTKPLIKAKLIEVITQYNSAVTR